MLIDFFLLPCTLCYFYQTNQKENSSATNERERENDKIISHRFYHTFTSNRIKMESDLTKRRPSLIPGLLPGLPAGWTPTIGSVSEDEQEDEQENRSQYSSGTIAHLPSIGDYDTKPFLTIKKFRRSNDQTTMSMAHTYGVCVLNTEEEEILACDHYNNRLLLFDSASDGRLLEIFRGDLATPECVVARPFYRQQVYLTKAHSLSLYDLEKKTFIQKLGSEENGHANNRFNSPSGLAVDPNNGFVRAINRDSSIEFSFSLEKCTCATHGIIGFASFRPIFVMSIVDGI